MQVQQVLTESPFFSSKRVHVEVAEGHVRLKGKVGSFYQKQMAQEMVRRVNGVRQVENRLRVDWLTPSDAELPIR